MERETNLGDLIKMNFLKFYNFVTGCTLAFKMQSIEHQYLFRLIKSKNAALLKEFTM